MSPPFYQNALFKSGANLTTPWPGVANARGGAMGQFGFRSIFFTSNIPLLEKEGGRDLKKMSRSHL